MTATLIAAAVLSFALGIVTRIVYDRKKAVGTQQQAEQQAERVLEIATREAETRKKEVELEALDKLYRERQEFEEKSRRQSDALAATEQRLATLEKDLAERLGRHEELERSLSEARAGVEQRRNRMDRREAELERAINEERGRLEKVANLSADEARRMLMQSLEKDARLASATKLKEIEDEIREAADGKAKVILAQAIQRWSSSHTAETTVSVVHLPSEEMKGRIIGREGRNIRALENATGVDLIIDDTPESVVLSSFNLFRREIAHQALKLLLDDGRIHPSRIEEVVAKVRDEMEGKIMEIGEQACQEARIAGLHPELVRLVGKLKFRTSYGQNILVHSQEVAHVAGVLAAEAGADVEVTRRGAFLHDIGKAVDQEKEGTHTALGVELLKKFGERSEVIHCVEAHHHDVPFESVEAYLVQAADAVSASRPGARRETLETYIKRLQKLEELAAEFKGVNQAFALQAGREIRIMVAHDILDDVASSQLARDVASKVEAELEYPGQIKVTVIRETRSVEYAK